MNGLLELIQQLLNFFNSLHQRIIAIESRLDAIEAVPEPEPAPLPDPEPVPTPAGVFFSNNFNYLAPRDGNVTQAFQSAGWDYMKSINSDIGRHLGYLYTVDDAEVPGSIGEDRRWLAMESVTGPGEQTDFYLQKEGPFPANLKIEFEICPNMDVGSMKFIYPTWGDYPAPHAPETLPWLVCLRSANFGWTGDRSIDMPEIAGSHDCYLYVLAPTMHWEKTAGDGPWKMMHTVPVAIPGDQRTKVTLRIDTSGTENEGGIVEAWIAPNGQEPIKVIDCHHGREVLGSMWTWPLPFPGRGIPKLRIPTTIDRRGITYITDLSFSDWSAS